MRLLLLLVTFMSLAQLSLQLTCDAGETQSSADVADVEKWLRGDADKINEQCFDLLAKQVHKELEASVTYLQMSADLISATSFRPGLAKFFLDSAAEERGHAKQFIKYFLMRGGKVQDIANQIAKITPKTATVADTTTALKKALELERQVTDSIRDIIVTCEGDGNNKKNDYHAVDFLTGEFLTEQHESIRKIVELLKTRTRMSSTFGALADVIFDQSLNKD